MEILKFQTNVTETVALKYRDGKEVQGLYGDQVLYTLCDDRAMYVDPPVARQIERLGVAPGEEFTIVKRAVADGRKQRIVWEVAYPSGEPARPAPPAPNGAAQPNGTTTNGTNGAARAVAAVPVETLAQKMERTGRAAVDAVRTVETYAMSQGLTLRFQQEDVRAIWVSAFIAAQNGRC